MDRECCGNPPRCLAMIDANLPLDRGLDGARLRVGELPRIAPWRFEDLLILLNLIYNSLITSGLRINLRSLEFFAGIPWASGSASLLRKNAGSGAVWVT